MSNSIDLALMECHSIALETTSPFLVKWAYDALAYYISSGRAPTEWCKAFVKANPRSLLYHMIGGKDHSDQAMIKRASSYLKRAA